MAARHGRPMGTGLFRRFVRRRLRLCAVAVAQASVRSRSTSAIERGLSDVARDRTSRSGHRKGDDRPRMGRHSGTQHAAAALVAVDILRHDLWAIGYWIVYPAWPLLSSATEGAFGWNTRSAVEQDIAELKTLRGPILAKLSSVSAKEIEQSPEL